MSVDLDRLLAHLDPDGRGGRRHVDEVATAICALAPHIDAAAVPELVRDTIQAGVRQGMWSSTRTVTVHRGRTTLPKSIILPRSGAPADQLRPVAVPLRDELASWAATLPLSQTQRQVLLAVNDWLRRTDGGNTAVAEAAERAYELLGDEKAFDSTPPRGGATLWGSGRLTFQLLRCHRTPTPLTWEPTTSTVSQPGPVLCVENHATCRSPSPTSTTSEISTQRDWPSRQPPAPRHNAPQYQPAQPNNSGHFSSSSPTERAGGSTTPTPANSSPGSQRRSANGRELS